MSQSMLLRVAYKWGHVEGRALHNMNGLLLRTIHSSRHWPNVRSISVTSVQFAKLSTNLEDNGIKDYLEKVSQKGKKPKKIVKRNPDRQQDYEVDVFEMQEMLQKESQMDDQSLMSKYKIRVNRQDAPAGVDTVDRRMNKLEEDEEVIFGKISENLEDHLRERGHLKTKEIAFHTPKSAKQMRRKSSQRTEVNYSKTKNPRKFSKKKETTYEESFGQFDPTFRASRSYLKTHGMLKDRGEYRGLTREKKTVIVDDHEELRRMPEVDHNVVEKADSWGSRSVDTDHTREEEDSPEWEDTFGTFSEESIPIGQGELYTFNEKYKDIVNHDEEEKPFRRLSAVDRKHDVDFYHMKIKRKLEEGKIEEALAVLEEDMLEKDRVLPDSYIYTLLITGLGKVGYTWKAFKLYSQMKKRGMTDIHPKTYTSLFNACSNAYDKRDGLSRARGLRELMFVKGVETAFITYKAMIKAFGICGDIQTAFLLVDEMAEKGHQIDVEVFSFLLMAAISDKTAGFQHAIKVYHTMQQMRIPPDIYIFNLLMEAVRLCGVQDANALVESGRKAQIMIQKQDEMEALQAMKKMEMRKMRETKKKKKKKKEAKKQESGETENGDSMKAETVNSSVNLPVELTTTESGLDILPENKLEQIEGITKNGLSLVEKGPSQVQETHVPNLLRVNTLDQVVSIGSIATASERLALIGGTAGILEILAMHQIQPDVRFFTQLLDSVEQNKDAELEVLAQMEKTGVVGDTGFYNRLIRRRNMRKDYEDAKDVLVLMSEKGIFPNMNTFGCLAMGCTKRHLANQLLETMDSAAFYPNNVIFAIFAKQSGDNFLYKLDLLKKMESLDIQPNDKFIMYIEDSIARAKRIIKIKELPPGKQAKFKPVPKFCDDQWYEYYKTFIQEWTPWLKRTMYQKPEHPWSRFGHEKQLKIRAEQSEKKKKKREAYLNELEKMKNGVNN